MQPTSLYKTTGLGEPRRSRRDALAWLANQLRWEQKLADLRSDRKTTRPQAA